jgi:glutamate N-acetyltransferase/amino-acid N-acetyltransferase
MNLIEGGVCAAQGFVAAGAHCGVKSQDPNKLDVALIASRVPCSAAGIFTKNVVKAAPIHVTREHLADGRLQAIVANSGIANACAPNGEAYAQAECALVGQLLGIEASDVAVASTGVIGMELNLPAIEAGLPGIASALTGGAPASDQAARAIMTTDTVKKELACEVEIGGAVVRIGGIAKGSGMIHPNMGTMLCFLTTDAAISPELIRRALLSAAAVSFNRISVDGDTSTNDTCLLLANGLAGNAPIEEEGPDFDAFVAALTELCVAIARRMAADGEGAKHLITCTVSQAESEEVAETLSKSVISSTLTKAAIFGNDANWGRVLCALGYSGVQFDPELVDVAFSSAAGRVEVCRAGRGLSFDEELATRVLSEPEVVIEVSMGAGDASCSCWGCDITHDYITINGDYRT